jgi:hypothetical protein
MSGSRALAERGPSTLPPVSSRGRWIGWGLAIELVGVGVPAAYFGANAHRMSVTGHITAASVRLAWRSDAHAGAGLALLIAGAAAFAAGSTVMARPFVDRRSTLLVAVPLMALLSVFVLGVVALLVAAAVAAGDNWMELLGPSPLRRWSEAPQAAGKRVIGATGAGR